MGSKEGMERRRFIQLLAMTGALAAAEPKAFAKGADPAHTPSRNRTHEPPRSAALQKEIATQKKALEGMLRLIRAHKLAAGSPPAFVFQPLRPSRARQRT